MKMDQSVTKVRQCNVNTMKGMVTLNSNDDNQYGYHIDSCMKHKFSHSSLSQSRQFKQLKQENLMTMWMMINKMEGK